MFDINHAEFIRNAREAYKRIGSISCPDFGAERIYFNSKGFDHLIFKNREYRSKREQIDRIRLIPEAVRMLTSCTRFSGYRSYAVDTKIGLPSPRVIHHLWSFTREDDKRKVTMVIRQIGNGSKHFLSVMSKTKTP